MGRRDLVGFVFGLLVLLLAAGGAAGALSQGSRANRAAAQRDAARQLAELSLPVGAVAVSSDPSAMSGLGQDTVGRTPYYNVIDDAGFWRVAGDPVSVESWVKSHPPPGSRLQSSGWIGTPTSGQLYAVFKFPEVPGEILERSLAVEVTSASGGGTAVRGDGLAVWAVTRPKWDRIPVEARDATATFTVAAARSTPATVSSTRLERIVRLINDAPVLQPAFRGCPKAINAQFVLTFQPRAGGAPIARATFYPTGCSSLALRVGGRRGPALRFGRGLTSILLAAGVVTPCATRVLSLSPTDNVEGPGMYRDFALREVGARPCEVAPRPTVKLLGAQHQPLSTPVGYQTAWRPIVLAPGLPADVFIYWSKTCNSKAAQAIQLSFNGIRRRLTTTVGSSNRPVDPCSAKIEFSPASLL